MITDFHTHTFPDAIAEKAIAALSTASHTVPFTDGTVKGLVSSMKNAGIGRSVVLPVATNPDKVAKMNDLSIELNGRDGLCFFGCMHPLFGGYKDELSRIAARGLKGIKIHPVYQNTDLDDIKYLRIFDRAAELGLAVVTHSGDDIGFPGAVYCTPEMANNVLRSVPKLKLVLAHMGGWRNWERAFVNADAENVYIDTSFTLGKLTPSDGHYKTDELQMLTDGDFIKLVRAFGSKKVLFGTDSPWSDQKPYLEHFLSLPLTKEEKDDILSRNAEKLLI